MKNLSNKKVEMGSIVVKILNSVQQSNKQQDTESLAACLKGLFPELYASYPYFAKLSYVSYSEICNILDWLVKNKYLQYINLINGKLTITMRAKYYLFNPKPFYMSYFQLQKSIPETLVHQLKEKRKELAVWAGVPVFKIASNHILRLIAVYQPHTLADLLEIDPTLQQWDFPTHWNSLLSVVSTTLSAWNPITPTIIETQKLYQEGIEPKVIAEKRNLAYSTILWHLEVLHYQKEINISQWIETQIEPKQLKIQAHYFKQSKQKKLKIGAQYLQISFQEARLARTYSWHQPI